MLPEDKNLIFDISEVALTDAEIIAMKSTEINLYKAKLGKIQEVLEVARKQWPVDGPSRPHFDRLHEQVKAIVNDRKWPVQILKTGNEPPKTNDGVAVNR